MGYFWMTAGTMFLLVVALVSLLAVLQAYRDGRGAPRSRQNWIAMSLWSLVAALALASGASMAWVTDHFFGVPTPSW